MRVCGDYRLHLTQNLSVGELAKHSHENGGWIWAVSSNFNTGSYNIPSATNGNAIEYVNGKDKQKVYSDSAGSNGYHNNISPGIAVYCWRRIS